MIKTNYFNIYNASAGTGKTFSLVRDYLILLFNSKNFELYKNILAITFTNKAVNEMKGRIVRYLINYSNSIDIDEVMIKEISNGGKPEFGVMKSRNHENPVLIPSISRAKKILGWKPKIKLKRGLNITKKNYNE